MQSILDKFEEHVVSEPVEYLHSAAPILLQVGSRKHKASEKEKHSHFSMFVFNSSTLLVFKVCGSVLIFKVLVI